MTARSQRKNNFRSDSAKRRAPLFLFFDDAHFYVFFVQGFQHIKGCRTRTVPHSCKKCYNREGAHFEAKQNPIGHGHNHQHNRLCLPCSSFGAVPCARHFRPLSGRNASDGIVGQGGHGTYGRTFSAAGRKLHGVRALAQSHAQKSAEAAAFCAKRDLLRPSCELFCNFTDVKHDIIIEEL